jgi:hypothetical protein
MALVDGRDEHESAGVVDFSGRMATSPSTHDAGRELGFKHQIFGSNEQISEPGQSDQLPIASIHRT